MSRKALIVSVVCVLGLVGLMFAVVLEIKATTAATQVGWIVTKDVKAGDAFDKNAVQRITLHPPDTTVLILVDSPLGHVAAHGLPAKTLLTPNDLLTAPMAQVSVPIANSPSFSAGDKVDLYYNTGKYTFQVGGHISVVGPGSNGLVIMVPVTSEYDWATLASTKNPLTAVKTSGDISGTSQPTTIDNALRDLSGNTLPGLPAAPVGP